MTLVTASAATAASAPAAPAPAVAQRRRLARYGLLAWILVSLILLLCSLNPQSAAAESTLRLHGALHREGPVGIISHRGAAALAPENTLSAMRVAIDQGVDFIETDVQLTADGVPILMHDFTLDRTTSGGGRVADHTLEQIKRLDAGGWFAPAYTWEPVPTLVEFVDLLGGAPTRALVELKGVWAPEQIASVVDLLRERQLVHRVALQSFDVHTLRMLQEVGPEFARVLLTREWDEPTVRLAGELQVSAVGARAKLYDERPELLDRLRAVGIGSLVYTLNSEKRWRAAVERGVDLVVTDDPVSLAEWRGPAPV
ncbi:hypothetical protein H490_0108405 [Leucobacter sp. UCD-THU]|uniref:glycerophosphodiester phosphodiesterase n=1 Tax=Leucobacter sp. UCD-THU TaxID=1292023 RepID=UPI00037CBB38|nr:glycerophosphodiester phosphodiesterase family protein [Leucobacter sp. UCD-THU]EYT54881.1 hypothetical protein H490_0108405 [Leucobacter sp. UCD-THU]